MKRFKRILIPLLLLFAILLVSCDTPNENGKDPDDNQIVETPTDEQILDEVANLIIIPKEVTDNLELLTEYELHGKVITAEWRSNRVDLIKDDGTVTQGYLSEQVTLTVKLTLGELEKNLRFTTEVVNLTKSQIIDKAISVVELPSETKENINLPLRREGVDIKWFSSNEASFTTKGVIGEIDDEETITLTAEYRYQGEKKSIDYQLKLIPLTSQERLDVVLDRIDELYPTVLSLQDTLPTLLPYGVKASFTSSNDNIITNNGTINKVDPFEEVTLDIVLRHGDESSSVAVKTSVFDFKEFDGHSYIERADNETNPDYLHNFNLNNMQNLHLDNGRLILDEGATEGTYHSAVINTQDFISLIGSWSALSGKTHTAELLIRLKVGTQWTSYLSYQPWGLGLENKSVTARDTTGLAQISATQISLLNSFNRADAIQYKVILKRDAVSNPSPGLSLVSLSLEIPGYKFDINEELPDFVDYEVPQLNQNIVPVIGNSICSPTSSTMLLKYKGHSFADLDEYEHRYIAEVTRDYGLGIFGNWVFNTVGISAFGENAYVKRMYSIDELMHHLYHYGPVSISVQGNMEKYTTNGHLIIIRGYRVTEDGIFFISNDPNLRDVYYEFKYETIDNNWRRIAYVIE